MQSRKNATSTERQNKYSGGLQFKKHGNNIEKTGHPLYLKLKLRKNWATSLHPQTLNIN